MTSSDNPLTSNSKESESGETINDNDNSKDLSSSKNQDLKADNSGGLKNSEVNNGSPEAQNRSPPSTRRSPTTLLRESPISHSDVESPSRGKRKESPLLEKGSESPVRDKGRDSPVSDEKRDSHVIDTGKASPPPGIQTGKVCAQMTADELFGPMSPSSPRRSNTFDQAADSHVSDFKKNMEPDSHRSRSHTDTTLMRFTTNFDPVYSKNANTYRDTKGLLDDRSHSSSRLNSSPNEVMFSKAEPGRRHYWERTNLNDNLDFKLQHKNKVNTRTLMIERSNFNNHLMSLKAERGYVPRLGDMTSRHHLRQQTQHDHGDFLDDDLLISATRLDSTLLRLFSHGSDPKRSLNDLDLPDYAQSDLISMDPVRWRVAPMLPSHKETLDHELEFIQENLKPRDVIKRLYDEDVITLMDYNMLTRTEGQGEKAVTRLLIGTLQRRGDRAWPVLLTALEELEYSHVTSKLSNTELFIRVGMEEDREKLEGDMERGKQLLSPLGRSNHLLRSSTYNSPSPLFKSPAPMTPPADSAVQERLHELDAELKALHDDVTTLKTSRQQTNETSKPKTPKSSDDVQGTSKTDAPAGAQKSGGCTIL